MFVVWLRLWCVLCWLVWWFNGDLAALLRFGLVFTGSFGLLDCVVVVGF